MRIISVPRLAGLAIFIVLVASAIYWGRQILSPVSVDAPVAKELPPPDLDQAGVLFGGDGAAPVDGNYRLLGIVVAKRAEDSVAVISVDEKPGQPFRLGAEVLPGVTIKDVQATHIILLANGKTQHLALPQRVINREGNEERPVGQPPATEDRAE